MSSNELWTMSILQAPHPHPPWLLLGEGAGLTSLLLGCSFRGFPQMKCWEESWTVGFRVLGLMNVGETSAHHRQPTGTSASRHRLCFVLETGWVWLILCPLRRLPWGPSLPIVRNLLQISSTNASVAGFFLYLFWSQRTVLAQTALLPACTLRC